jgi:hypothetical protein
MVQVATLKEEHTAGSFRARLIVFLAISIVTLPIVLGLGMTKGLSHDEHQHIAAGALIAREGLLPYRDFPHFHTPYLAYAYALAFRVSDHLLVAGRLISVLSATAILGIIGAIAYQLFLPRGKSTAVLVCFGSVLLAITTQLFTETSGYAWNHEPALFFSMAAFVAHVAGLRSSKAGWFAVSGAMLAIAIGIRITCAPLVAPFGLSLLLHGTRPFWQWKRILPFCGGLLLGLSGLFYFLAIAPEQTLFDNFGFAKANVIYRFSTGEPRTMTIGTKLRFFWKLVVRPDWGLFIAGLLPLVGAHLANRGTPRKLPIEGRFVLLLLPFVLIGSFAPSPLFDQYFYPLVPFLLLTGLYAWASIPAESPWYRRVLVANSVAVVLSLAMGISAFEDFKNFFKLRRWHGIKLHEQAQELKDKVGSGRVLTLAPICPLEANLSIYPSFSTGPIAWRVSPYIDPAKAQRLGITTPTTLATLLAAEAPSGVLVGFEKNGEEILSNFAKDHGYVSIPFDEEGRVWVSPKDPR